MTEIVRNVAWHEAENFPAGRVGAEKPGAALKSNAFQMCEQVTLQRAIPGDRPSDRVADSHHSWRDTSANQRFFSVIHGSRPATQ